MLDPATPARLWKRLDAVEHPPRYLTTDDCCYFAREYFPRGRFSDYPTTSLIQNFKKPVQRKGKPEWRFKEDAICQFALELSQFLPEPATIAHIPTSLLASNPD